MAHNLEQRDGRASVVYVGETPWHTLGEKLDPGATVEEAFTKSRLNYPVQLGFIQARLSYDHTPVRADGYRAIMRGDNGAVLGVVSPRYTPVQNAELAALAQVFNTDGRVTVETMGVLGIGERVWIQARWSNPLELPGGDTLLPFLVITTSHDGRHPVSVFNSVTRVVCQNTLNAAFHDGKNHHTIRHTGDMRTKLLEVGRALGASDRAINEFGAYASFLQSKTVTVAEAEAFWLRLVPNDSGRSKNIRTALADSFESAPGAQATRWGLVNAVSHYVDHKRAVRGAGGDTGRLTSALFGTGADIKTKALQLAGV